MKCIFWMPHVHCRRSFQSAHGLFSILFCFFTIILFFHVNGITPSFASKNKHDDRSFSQSNNKIQVPKTTSKKSLAPNRLEPGFLPAINFDVDTGFGFGLLGNLAKFQKGFYPYKWRLTALLYATFKSTETGVEFPYHDDYLRIDFPGLFGGLLRINSQMGFAMFTTAGYYGLGNASSYINPSETFDPIEQREEFLELRRSQQYKRIYPNARINGRFKIFSQPQNTVEVFVGGRGTYNAIEVNPGSQLEEDISGKNGSFIKSILFGTQNHGELMGNVGIIWDTRDDEAAPTKGFFNELSIRAGTGIGETFAYTGINTTLRWYISLFKEYLVVAVRAIGDTLIGNVSFYELPAVGGLVPFNATGGGSSIRGVAFQRYHGKAKILGNLELRSKIIPFEIAGQRFNFGIIAFYDAGRVWADYSFDSEETAKTLDGEGFGLKQGVGGGIRLQWGATFIIRADYAYSPSDQRSGFYLNINHIY